MSNTKVTRVAVDVLARNWVGIEISEKTVDFVVHRTVEAQKLFHDIVNHDGLSHRTNLGPILKYNAAENKNMLYGKQRSIVWLVGLTPRLPIWRLITYAQGRKVTQPT